MIRTVTYNSNHTRHEDPEKESSYEPQEYHKHPTEEHGDSQATRGKSIKHTGIKCAKHNIKLTARQHFYSE